MVGDCCVSGCEVIEMSRQDRGEFDKRCRSEWVHLIEEWVHSELDRKMIARVYLDGMTIEKVAEEFDISVNHCQLRVDKAKKQLFSHIKII
jgi:DNA-directed RNA polymerase specialized sigma subunit